MIVRKNILYITSFYNAVYIIFIYGAYWKDSCKKDTPKLPLVHYNLRLIVHLGVLYSNFALYPE